MIGFMTGSGGGWFRGTLVLANSSVVLCCGLIETTGVWDVDDPMHAILGVGVGGGAGVGGGKAQSSAARPCVPALPRGAAGSRVGG